MTKQDLENDLWSEYIIWCSRSPEGKPTDLIFWLDHNRPTQDSFWEWVVRYKADSLKTTE